MKELGFAKSVCFPMSAPRSTIRELAFGQCCGVPSDDVDDEEEPRRASHCCLGGGHDEDEFEEIHKIASHPSRNDFAVVDQKLVRALQRRAIRFINADVIRAALKLIEMEGIHEDLVLKYLDRAAE